MDRRTGERLAGRCLDGRPYEPRVLRVWPAELVAWRRAQGQPVTMLPAWSADCSGVPRNADLRIISPDAGTPYVMRRDAPAEHQRIALTARVAPDARRVFWYQDGDLVASGVPSAKLFVGLRRGAHEIVVVDELGRSHAVTYRVE